MGFGSYLGAVLIGGAMALGGSYILKGCEEDRTDNSVMSEETTRYFQQGMEKLTEGFGYVGKGTVGAVEDYQAHAKEEVASGKKALQQGQAAAKGDLCKRMDQAMRDMCSKAD